MDNKEAQIEELSNLLSPYFHDPIDDPCPYCKAAEALYAAGYRKLPMVKCPKCQGFGYLSPGHRERMDCPDCHGSGKVVPERPKIPRRTKILRPLERQYSKGGRMPEEPQELGS